MSLPTFVIVGAQKSGTRWLRQNLGEHRSVFTADRELEFFNHHYDEGLDWYRAQFESSASETAIGEATPGYMFHADDPAVIAQRMHDSLGSDLAVVAILRDPIERTRSSYIHHLRRDRIDPEVDPIAFLRELDQANDSLGVISGGWYAQGLEPFVERFDRVLVEFHADISTHGEELYVRVLEHIGVDDPWVPATMSDVVFSGVKQVSKAFPDHPILELDAEEMRLAIGDSFDEETQRLEAMIGRPVPWAGDRVASNAHSEETS